MKRVTIHNAFKVKVVEKGFQEGKSYTVLEMVESTDSQHICVVSTGPKDKYKQLAILTKDAVMYLVAPPFSITTHCGSHPSYRADPLTHQTHIT